MAPRPFPGRNGSGVSSPCRGPISVSENTPVSMVLIRPARLSRPCSMRRAELPVIHGAHGSVVHEELQLHVPAADDLHLVEEEMRPLPGPRQTVEVRAGDVVLEPVRDAQDRVDEIVQRPQLVELHAEDRVGRDALGQQILDDLELRRGLAHLPRAAHRDDGCKFQIQPAADLADEMASRAGLHRRGLACPPGILPAQVGYQSRRKLRNRKHRTAFVHGCSTFTARPAPSRSAPPARGSRTRRRPSP